MRNGLYYAGRIRRPVFDSCPAGVPLVLQGGGEGRAGGFCSFTGHRGCFPVRAGDGRGREVPGLRAGEGGVDRPAGGCEALRALLRQRFAGDCTGGWCGVTGSGRQDSLPASGAGNVTRSIRHTLWSFFKQPEYPPPLDDTHRIS